MCRLLELMEFFFSYSIADSCNTVIFFQHTSHNQLIWFLKHTNYITSYRMYVFCLSNITCHFFPSFVHIKYDRKFTSELKLATVWLTARQSNVIVCAQNAYIVINAHFFGLVVMTTTILKSLMRHI